MARLLKKSTAFTFRIGPLVDSTDGATAETGLSIGQADIQISKDGGAFAQTSASPTTTHDTDGWYQCPLTASDTDTLGPLTVQINVSGALPVWEHFMVVPANVYDSLVDDGDKLDVNSAQVGGQTASATAGVDFDDIAAILVDTGTTLNDLVDDLESRLTAARAGYLDNLNIGENVAGTSEIAALNDLSAAEVNAEADTALTDFFTSAAQLIDDIWDEVITGANHNVNNSAAKFLREAAEGVGVTGTAQAGANNSITLAAGESATDDLYNFELVQLIEGTGAGQARLITDYNGTTKVATVHRNWTTNPDSTSVYSIQGADTALAAILDQTVTATGAVDFDDLAAILTDTAEIGAAGAGLTEAGGTGDHLTALPESPADVTAISGDSTAADRLEALMDGLIVGQVNDASATTTAFAADGFTEATDDHFNGRLITFMTGALAGQQTDITDYDAAGGTQGSQEFTVSALTEAPADDDFFVIH